MNPVRSLWRSRPVRFLRRTRWVHIVLILGLSFAYAFWLDREQGEEFARDFARDSALADYASCQSGNRLRQGNLDLVDGILAALPTEGREAFLPIWREAQNDFQPRNCEPLRVAAVNAGVGDRDLERARTAPPPVDELPLATCEGLGPFVEGVDEGYIPELDRDSDGVACEPVDAAVPVTPPASCAEADGPIRRGEPGYSPDLDGDGDGVACEG